MAVEEVRAEEFANRKKKEREAAKGVRVQAFPWNRSKNENGWKGGMVQRTARVQENSETRRG